MHVRCKTYQSRHEIRGGKGKQNAFTLEKGMHYHESIAWPWPTFGAEKPS